MKSIAIKIKFAVLILVGLLCQSTAQSQEMLYPFSVAGKYGYINKTGKVVLPAQFEYSEKFYEGLKQLVLDSGMLINAKFKNEIVGSTVFLKGGKYGQLS